MECGLTRFACRSYLTKPWQVLQRPSTDYEQFHASHIISSWMTSHSYWSNWSDRETNFHIFPFLSGDSALTIGHTALYMISITHLQTKKLERYTFWCSLYDKVTTATCNWGWIQITLLFRHREKECCKCLHDLLRSVTQSEIRNVTKQHAMARKSHL
jgi:hypothetical protein